MEEPKTVDSGAFYLDPPPIPDFKAMTRKQVLNRLSEAGREETARLRRIFLSRAMDPRCAQVLNKHLNINTQSPEPANKTVSLGRVRNLSPLCLSQKTTLPDLKGLIDRNTMTRLPLYVAVQADTREAFVYPEKKYKSSLSCFSAINKHRKYGTSDSCKQRREEESILTPVERVTEADRNNDIVNRKLYNVLFRKSVSFRDAHPSDIMAVTKTLPSSDSNRYAVTNRKVGLIKEDSNRVSNSFHEAPKVHDGKDILHRDKAHCPEVSNTFVLHQRRSAYVAIKSSSQCLEHHGVPSHSCLKRDNIKLCTASKPSLLRCQHDNGHVIDRPCSEQLTRSTSKSDLTRYMYKRHKNYFIHPEWFSEEIGWQRHFHESTPEKFRYAWM